MTFIRSDERLWAGSSRSKGYCGVTGARSKLSILRTLQGTRARTPDSARRTGLPAPESLPAMTPVTPVTPVTPMTPMTPMTGTALDSEY